MSKYSRELDEKYVQKVKDMANSFGLKSMGITVEAVKIKKCKTYGEVVKSNDFATLFTNDPDLICVALNEQLFDRVDEATQDYWIESLLSQVSYDNEKEKIVITKPELNVGRGMYEKYKGVAIQKEELALLTLQQIAEEKAAEKAERAAKKREKALKAKGLK